MQLTPAICVTAAVLLGQTGSGTPVRTTLCAMMKQPERFQGKLVTFRALVEPGVEELPAGVADDSCSAELKFLTPDDPHLALLLKSAEFRKLTKLVAKKPAVEATLTGWFVREKSNSGLMLESVAEVAVKARKPAP